MSRPTNRSHCFVTFCLVPTFLVLLVSSTHALSTSFHMVDMNITLDSATYVSTGQPIFPGDLQIFVTRSVDQVTFQSGDGTRSGTASTSISGAPIGDGDDFNASVGDAFQSEQNGTASASSFGSAATGGTRLTWFVDVENFSFEDINLTISWEYAQKFVLTNDTAGNQAAAFLDASASITNFADIDETIDFVVDENFGNLNANTFQNTFSNSGMFSLLIDGNETASSIEFEVEVVNNVRILVPEPGTVMLLVFSLAALLVRRTHVK